MHVYNKLGAEFQDLQDYVASMQQYKQQQCQVQLVTQQVANIRPAQTQEEPPLHPRIAREVTCAGAFYHRQAAELLDQFHYTRSADQKRFHKAVFQVLAPIIYQQDFLACRDQLLRRYAINEFQMAVMLMCPRRWGKSVAAAQAMAVLLHVARGVKIVVFSTGQEMSTIFMQMVQEFFLQLPDTRSRLLFSNQKRFLVKRSDDCNDKSKSKEFLKQSGRYNILSARAATVHGNKGITADVFVLEEASRIDGKILSEVIAPMLKVHNSVLVALSTHLGKHNYYTKLMEKKCPTLARLAIRIHIELVCAACKRDRRTDCTHMQDLHPPWLVADNEERVRMLMGDDNEMYAQEVLGVIYGDRGAILKEEWVAQVQGKPAASLVLASHQLDSYDDDHIVTMIDPAGGGASNTAIVSIVRRDLDVYICGMAETNAVREQELAEFLAVYWSRMEQHRQFGRARHVLCVESNYGGTLMADIIVKGAQRVFGDVVEYRARRDTPGVVTTHEVKSRGIMNSMCDFCANRIHVADTAIFVHTDLSPSPAVLKEFFAQCRRLRKVVLPRTGRWTYNGKTDDGGRDDLAIAFLLASFYSLQILSQQ
jgi:hypothetical protein